MHFGGRFSQRLIVFFLDLALSQLPDQQHWPKLFLIIPTPSPVLLVETMQFFTDVCQCEKSDPDWGLQVEKK